MADRRTTALRSALRDACGDWIIAIANNHYVEKPDHIVEFALNDHNPELYKRVTISFQWIDDSFFRSYKEIKMDETIDVIVMNSEVYHDVRSFCRWYDKYRRQRDNAARKSYSLVHSYDNWTPLINDCLKAFRGIVPSTGKTKDRQQRAFDHMTRSGTLSQKSEKRRTAK